MRRPSLVSILRAIILYLPPVFSLSLLVLTIAWTLFVFDLLPIELRRTALELTHLSKLDHAPLGMLIIAIYFGGLLLVYNISVGLNTMLVRYVLKPVTYSTAHPFIPNQSQTSERFKGIGKIGIVLAGGGAKGAFQAGAMKAIYQFLAQNQALDKVGVIAGTSIGSWNALFWLANLIGAKGGWTEPSAHEIWWRSINLKSLLAPSWYVPTWRNAFCSTVPWKNSFDGIFEQSDVRKQIIESKIHFYFMRSNVGSGALECTTNNPQFNKLPRVKYTVVSRSNGDDAFLKGVKDGVFASMDLPPLFPYVELDGGVFEDGGVIDNLPIIFAAVEQCDFIFVLALNSDFDVIPNKYSVISRFFRVMDVRQGALERNSLKILYLYNELAVLRDYVHRLEKDAGIIDRKTGSPTLDCALSRNHQPSRIFAVCPQSRLVQDTIDTQEFWKSKAAGDAFRIMYDRTLELLQSDFDPSQERIRMALVSSGLDKIWVEDLF